MPFAAPRICGCGQRVAGSARCSCQRARQAEAAKARPSARERGYTGKWERESKAYLALPGNGTCRCGRAADCVDHIVAHKGDQRLFWNRSNWRPSCVSCNSRKAAREEGGFGRPVREHRP